MINGREVIFHMTRRDTESTIKQIKSDYHRRTQAVVRFLAVIPSPIQMPAADN